MVPPPDDLAPTAAPEPRPDAQPAARRGAGRGSVPRRAREAWASLPHERRLAGGAALSLILTLFLPWYQETVIAQGTASSLSTLSTSLTGWGAFSWVEAAVLLVSAAVVVLLFMRAEGAAFHVPGGDGGVVTAAGVWTCLLIVWRMFDKQGTSGHGLVETTSGVEWGIFIALAVAAVLVYAGSRIKLANEPEPPLPGDPDPARVRDRAQRRAARSARIPGTRTAPADRPAPADRTAPARRARPVAPAESAPVTAATAVTPPADRTRVMPTEPAPAPRRRSGRRPHRSLDFTELEGIEFDEPPEAPTVSRRPPE